MSKNDFATTYFHLLLGLEPGSDFLLQAKFPSVEARIKHCNKMVIAIVNQTGISFRCDKFSTIYSQLDIKILAINL